MPSKNEQIMALVYLIRNLEWTWPREDDVVPSCPECRALKGQGHNWQCQLAQALDFYEKVP